MLKLEKILMYLTIPVFFYMFHMFLDLVFDIYDRFPWFSNVMHLVGGMMLGITFFLLLNYLNREKYIQTDKYARFIFAISLVGLFGIFWEFYEFAIVRIFDLNLNLTYEDTLWDLLVDLVGGAIAGFWFLMKE